MRFYITQRTLSRLSKDGVRATATQSNVCGHGTPALDGPDNFRIKVVEATRRDSAISNQPILLTR